MSDTPPVPPTVGWHPVPGRPDEQAYFDGIAWTARGHVNAAGQWEQAPYVAPPGATPGDTPTAVGPADPGAPSPYGAGPPPNAPLAATPWGAAPSGPGWPPPASEGFAAPGWPAGGWAPAANYPPPGRLDLFVTAPAAQARWKTLLRIILVIPSAIVLYALTIALEVVAILMWFAALFSARVPAGMWRFARSVLQFQARTAAYLYLLTDRYPPFALEDSPYPVMFTLDGPPDRFNRAAVLFRGVLAFPAGVVVTVLTVGMWPFLLVAWLVTLVTGRNPDSFHGAFAIALRYTLRFYAWYFLLTTRYPSQPVGDEQVAPEQRGPGALVVGRGIAIASIVVGAITYVLYLVAIPTFLGTTLRNA